MNVTLKIVHLNLTIHSKFIEVKFIRQSYSITGFAIASSNRIMYEKREMFSVEYRN